MMFNLGHSGASTNLRMDRTLETSVSETPESNIAGLSEAFANLAFCAAERLPH